MGIPEVALGMFILADIHILHLSAMTLLKKSASAIHLMILTSVPISNIIVSSILYCI